MKLGEHHEESNSSSPWAGPLVGLKNAFLSKFHPVINDDKEGEEWQRVTKLYANQLGEDARVKILCEDGVTLEFERVNKKNKSLLDRGLVAFLKQFSGGIQLRDFVIVVDSNKPEFVGVAGMVEGEICEGESLCIKFYQGIETAPIITIEAQNIREDTLAVEMVNYVEGRYVDSMSGGALRYARSHEREILDAAPFLDAHWLRQNKYISEEAYQNIQPALESLNGKVSDLLFDLMLHLAGKKLVKKTYEEVTKELELIKSYWWSHMGAVDGVAKKIEVECSVMDDGKEKKLKVWALFSFHDGSITRMGYDVG